MKKMLPPETEKAAFLLLSKSVIQLAINPLVAVLISKIGYYVSLLIGNVILLVASLGMYFEYPILPSQTIIFVPTFQ